MQIEDIIKKTNITDPDTILYILAHEEARKCHEESLEKKRLAKYIKEKGWLKVPNGLSKKELNKLKKDTQEIIDSYKAKERSPGVNDITKQFYIASKEEWMEKKKIINKRLDLHEGLRDNKCNIEKAKQYPMENLLEFNNAGFAKCLWHEENTPSLKLYRDRNKVHCFAGCGDFDTIDVYQKINNVAFNVAVKALS